MEKAILEAKELLKELEGLYLKPYQCPAGKWTIGYGDNLEANGLTAEEAKLVNFDKAVIPADLLKRWTSTGIGTTEIKTVLHKYHNAIKTSKETAEVLLDNEVMFMVQQLTRHDYFNDAPNNVKVALICICFQCGFVGMNTNIYLKTKQWWNGSSTTSEKRYFIDHIKQKDYKGAAAMLRHAPIFNTTRARAAKMADLIYTD
jgi:GH24 family phage-related lysozyme (muramidase)